MDRDGPLIDEEKEKAAIEWENKVLAILMPAVGLAAFVIGVVGAILLLNINVPIAVFLIILAALGVGGMIYGAIAFIKKRQNRVKKENKQPDQE